MSWKCEQHSQIRTEGLTIILSNHMSYAPVNSLFKPLEGGIVNGKHYFEFEFKGSKNSSFFGVTDEEHFKPGYQLKALLFGGDLSDGSRLLVSDFGDKVANNDKVGILLDFEVNYLRLYYFVNGTPLGLAFYVSGPNLKPLFPVVQLFRSSRVTISEHRSLPIGLERAFIQYVGIEGCWKIDRCDHNGVMIPYFTDIWRKFTLKITPDSRKQHRETFNLLFNIGNVIFATLRNNKGKWYCCLPVYLTKLQLSGQIAAAEDYLYRFFDNFNGVQLIGQSLVFTARQPKIVTTDYIEKITFKRCVAKAPQSVTINPLK